MAVTESESFSIGRVASRTFSVIGRNAVPFFLLALISSAPSAFVSTLRGTAPVNTLTASYWETFTAGLFLAMFLSALLQATITYSTLLDLNGERPSLAKALMVGAKAAIPLFVLSIVYSLGIGLATILLVFPGLMLATAWIISVPSYVSEKTGIFGAFGRSAELTKGYRWSIFGLLVIYIIVLFVVLMAQGVTVLALQAVPFAPFIVTLLVSTVLATISATGVAAIYYELRTIKEGVGPQQIASVFA